MNEEEDERIDAWHKIASHPFFKPAYELEKPLVEAMYESLDALTEWKVGARSVPELPVEHRIERAFLNGYQEGFNRGSRKGLDH